MTTIRKILISLLSIVIVFTCLGGRVQLVTDLVVAKQLTSLSAATTGLKGEYYNDMALTDLKMTRTDANINFHWGEGSTVASIQPDHFSVRWTGTIKPRFTETYTYDMASDDGVRLWINGQLIINKWVTQASVLSSLPIKMTAGQSYNIQVEYFENGGGATAELQWSSPSQKKEVVPQSQLSPPIATVGTGLKGEYYENMDLTGLKLTRVDSTVNHNWGSGSPHPSIGVDTFSVRCSGTIKPDDGLRLWINEKLLIDKWLTRAGELTSLPISLRYEM